MLYVDGMQVMKGVFGDANDVDDDDDGCCIYDVVVVVLLI